MIINNKQRLFEMMYKVGGMPQEHEININELLQLSLSEEVDLENDFADVNPVSCMNPVELKNYLNDILINYNLPSNKRKKPDLIIHNKVIHKTSEGDIDVDDFINQIIAEPKTIITGGNTKMIKSSTDDFHTVTIGLPAFRGLVYDNGNDRFLVVNTCPGSSDTCKNVCYARKGNYVRLPNVYLKQTRILNLLMNNPEKFKENLKNKIISIYKLGNKNKKGQMRFRWNDSGDFFSKKYFDIGREIMNELKNENFDVKPYAHTKIADIYNTNRGNFSFDPKGISIYNKPDFVISFSTDSHKDQIKQVNLKDAKTSEIMFKDFQDLFEKNEKNKFIVDDKGKLIFKDKDNGMKKLKQRVANEFGVPNDGTLLSHDEMMSTKEADRPTYSVIVQSKGETDISTQRHDVMRTFFMIH